MKKLSNLKGAKKLTKQEQQSVNGGNAGNPPFAICRGNGVWSEQCHGSDGYSDACIGHSGKRCIINGYTAICLSNGCYGML